MQRRRKKLKNALLIALIISSFGCGGAPKKPVLEIATPFVDEQKVFVCVTNNETWSEVKTSKDLTVNDVRRLVAAKSVACEWKPMIYINKGLCLNQLNSNIFIDYVHDLENYIAHQCKSRLDGKPISPSSRTQ